MERDINQSSARATTCDSNSLPDTRDAAKENQASGVDVDKDHDSMEELDEEEDIIRIFVESEVVDDDDLD